MGTRSYAICLAAAVLACLTLPTVGYAETFFVDPEDGSPDGDGSRTDPWATLQQVVDDGLIATRDWNAKPYNDDRTLTPKHPDAPVGPGDTIVLMSGDHGAVEIAGAYNESPILIRAGEDETPKLSRLHMRSVANWTIRGLTISPSFADGDPPGRILYIDSHPHDGPSRDVRIAGCAIYSVDDASGWDTDDWDTEPASGISADGSGIHVDDNTLRNVNHGITFTGPDGTARHNTIVGFSGAGIRPLGDRNTVAYNVIKNGYGSGSNSGVKAWTTGPDGEAGNGELVGTVVRGNLLINHEDPDHPHRATMQAVGLFDGMYIDWTIANNVIVADHWHGISLYGARDSRVVNNTVLELADTRPGPPWIKVRADKDGTPSENVVVRNNLATDFRLTDNVTADHNTVIDDPEALFVDPAAFNFHLRDGSPAVDGGRKEGAPQADLDRIARPQGEGIDLGAYERHEEDTDVGACSADADCPTGKRCRNGTCRTLACSDITCGPNQACYRARCYPECQADGDCAHGETCIDNSCRASDCSDVTCGSGETCYRATCYPECQADGDCGSGEQCIDNDCRALDCSNITCSGNETCFRGRCYPECQADGDCAAGEVCEDNACAPPSAVPAQNNGRPGCRLADPGRRVPFSMLLIGLIVVGTTIRGRRHDE